MRIEIPANPRNTLPLFCLILNGILSMFIVSKWITGDGRGYWMTIAMVIAASATAYVVNEQRSSSSVSTGSQKRGRAYLVRAAMLSMIPVDSGVFLPKANTDSGPLGFSLEDVMQGKVSREELREAKEKAEAQMRGHIEGVYEKGLTDEARTRLVEDWIADGEGSIALITLLLETDNPDLQKDLLTSLDGIVAPTYSEVYEPVLGHASKEELLEEVETWNRQRKAEESKTRRAAIDKEIQERVREKHPELFEKEERINESIRQSYVKDYEKGQSQEKREDFIRRLTSKGHEGANVIARLLPAENEALRKDLLTALDQIIAPTYSQTFPLDMEEAQVNRLIEEIEAWESGKRLTAHRQMREAWQRERERAQAGTEAEDSR